MRSTAAAAILVLWAATAAARPTGITGVSGKAGSFCNQCHSGGATPTVTLSGPAALAPGQRATYTLTITGGAAVAGGLDAALDDAALAAGATLATVSPSTQLSNGEITHTQPVSFSGATLTFQFAVTAPASARTMTLYAAGNSTNHDGTNSGDRAAAATLAITVGNGVPAPAGGDLGAADLATDPPGGASDLASTPSPSGRDLTTPAGDSGSAGPPAGTPSPAPSASGCSVATAPSASPAWLLVALGALVSRRARRRCARPASPTASAFASARARR